MAKARLNEKQIAAITILSQPKRAGMTYEEIAKEVGVSKTTLFQWKKLDGFNDELKREIVRNTTARLPDVFESIVDSIIETGNAASFRTLVQLHGMLTDRVEIDSTGGNTADMDAIKAEIDKLRRADEA